MSQSTFIIDTSDERGTPLKAHCDTCGLIWYRPDGDQWADTLAVFAREHHRTITVTPTTDLWRYAK